MADDGADGYEEEEEAEGCAEEEEAFETYVEEEEDLAAAEEEMQEEDLADAEEEVQEEDLADAEEEVQEEEQEDGEDAAAQDSMLLPCRDDKGKVEVRQRQQLRTPSLCKRFCAELSDRIEQEKGDGNTLVIEDLDISENRIPADDS